MLFPSRLQVLILIIGSSSSGGEGSGLSGSWGTGKELLFGEHASNPKYSNRRQHLRRWKWEWRSVALKNEPLRPKTTRLIILQDRARLVAHLEAGVVALVSS